MAPINASIVDSFDRSTAIHICEIGLNALCVLPPQRLERGIAIMTYERPWRALTYYRSLLAAAPGGLSLSASAVSGALAVPDISPVDSQQTFSTCQQ
ncbi:hypothetical protein ANO11243_047950 [Dothideomycetidae sp. 11243]|nr:hypothetical protein ANO11243_047950 [fungal sp. No.11243]